MNVASLKAEVTLRDDKLGAVLTVNEHKNDQHSAVLLLSCSL